MSREPGQHSGLYHFLGHAYRRHFEDYAEYSETDERGRSVIRRVYTGEYYLNTLQKRRAIWHRVALTLLWTAAVCCYLWASSMRDAGNGVWYVVLGEAAALPCLFWTASGLFNCWIGREKLTVGEWRASSQRVKRGGLLSSLCLVFSALASVLHLFISGGRAQSHIFCAAGLFCAACAMLAVYCLERRAVYRKLASEESSPSFAARITS